MRAKIVLITGSCLVAALIAVATLPWWFGLALGWVGVRHGLSFGEYRRIGYTRFALADVRINSGAAEVKVSRIELDTPLYWFTGSPGPVVVDDWSVAVANGRPRGDAPSGWMVLRGRLDRIVTELGNWLPSATARRGSVTWPGGRIDVEQAAWTSGELKVAVLRWKDLAAAADLKCDAKTGRWQADVRDRADHWTSAWVSEGAALTGEGTWFAQPWTASAKFGPAGWLPLEAEAGAKAWAVPGGRLKLGAYYATITGDGTLHWKERALSLDVQASGTPVEGRDVPPLHVVLHGSGGADRLSIDRLELAMPGVKGRLNEPIVIGSGGRLESGASRFELTADLEKLPWVRGRGHAGGMVTVTPRAEGVPLLEAVLSSADASLADWTATKTEVAVRIEWPEIKLTAGRLELAGGDRLELGGTWNAGTRTLTDGKVSAQISHATAARWLPAKTDFETLAIDATASGVWPGIGHQGKIAAQGLRVAPLRPLALTAEWQGKGRTITKAQVEASAGGTHVRLTGGVDAQSARLDELVLTQGAEERLRLVKPARVAWSPAWMVEPVELKGPAGSVSGQFDRGKPGRLTLDVRNLGSAWLNELVALRGPSWTVSTLTVQGNWDGGPLVFKAAGSGTVVFAEGKQAELALSVQGDAAGLEIGFLRATLEQRPVVKIAGRIPVSLWPGANPSLRFDDDAPLALDATTEADSRFWDYLGGVIGLELTRPEINLKLAGTLKKPTGEGRVALARLAPGGAAWARTLPEIEGLQARLTGDRGGMALETFTARVAGQEVRASGRLPVKDWAALAADPLALADAGGEARIEIPDADVAALARYAPAYLAPAGKLQVDVSLKPGGQLYGTIRLKDAATRPLGPLGILQSIGAEIELAGRTVKFTQVRASMGGQPVTLTGAVELAKGGAPRLDLALRGENLPFVRQAGLLVRGDLDLRIVTDGHDATRITGTTRLRDSLFLMDVRALLPTGGARNAPGRRPPYFAVNLAPFNAWGLDVAVEGDRFLRLRTPVFTGVVSAHFRLGGTLGDPRVLGEAVVNQGQVMLPFATFAVRQGRVRLTEADPFEPALALVGTSRRYGYDLRMEINGTVDRPELVFTSTPMLESEQVLLMVMAGETPQNEITYTGSQRAARLGAYLGQSLLGQFGADPATAERFSVDIGERVSAQGRETYNAEYELSPRWSVVGEYDEFDEYNLGVKWRVWTEKRPENPANAKK